MNEEHDQPSSTTQEPTAASTSGGSIFLGGKFISSYRKDFLKLGLQNDKDKKAKNPYSIDEILRSEQGTSSSATHDRKRHLTNSDSEEDIDEGESKASKRTSPESDSKGESCTAASRDLIGDVKD